MRIGRHGWGAIVTAIVSLALAASDYSGFAERVAAILHIDPKNLPLVYMFGFLIALLLLRWEYQTADYDFVFDPNQEYVFEPDDGGHEIHRVTVRNFGHHTINVRVLLDGIDPEPRQFSGKLGMPLIPMGKLEDKDGFFVVNPKRSHSVNFVDYHYGRKALTLWHTWASSGAPTDLASDGPHVAFVFRLALTPMEGDPKEATYQLRRVADMTIDGRIYRLTKIVEPTRLERATRWVSGVFSARA